VTPSAAACYNICNSVHNIIVTVAPAHAQLHFVTDTQSVFLHRVPCALQVGMIKTWQIREVRTFVDRVSNYTIIL